MTNFSRGFRGLHLGLATAAFVPITLVGSMVANEGASQAARASGCSTKRVIVTRVVTTRVMRDVKGREVLLDVARRVPVRVRREVRVRRGSGWDTVEEWVPRYRVVSSCAPSSTTAPAGAITSAAPAAEAGSASSAPTSSSSTSASTTTTAVPSSTSGWTLEQTYTFSGNSLNLSQWYPPYDQVQVSATGGYWLASHAVVANDMLTLSEYQDAAAGGEWAGSGVKLIQDIPVNSMVEVRMRVDAGAGVGAVALLMGANDWPPEIDFYEDDPTSAARDWNRATAHYGENNTMVWNDETGVDATQWHTWGVEWTTSSITYTVDGDVWASIPNPDPDSSDPNSLVQPQNLCLQIGTTTAGPNASTPSVVNMQIQWVAIYSKSD